MSYIFNAKEHKDKCIEWIKEWFNENGKESPAVIGLSGGKDSAIVAALCVEALGKDRVIGVSLPNTFKDESPLVHEIADLLDIRLERMAIYGMISAANYQLEPCVENISEQTKINLPARIRMSMLYAFAQSVGGRVSNNCNLSENYVGYFTRWGDGVGDFAPLADLTVTEVKAIGKELGLPLSIVDEPPADGLCGKTDEENLGFTYEQLDEYIRRDISVFKIIDYFYKYTDRCASIRALDPIKDDIMVVEESIGGKMKELHEKNLFKELKLPYYESDL